MSGLVGTAGSKSGIIGQLSGREHIATFDGYTNPQSSGSGDVGEVQGGHSTLGSGLDKVYRPQYEHYIIDISNLGISGSGQQILFRFVNSSGSYLDGNYNYIGHGKYASDGGSGDHNQVENNDSKIELIANCQGATGCAINGTIKLTGMGSPSAEFAVITGNFSAPVGGSGEHAIQSLSGFYTNSGSNVHGFFIYVGTIGTYFNSGQISVYGIRKR